VIIMDKNQEEIKTNPDNNEQEETGNSQESSGENKERHEQQENAEQQEQKEEAEVDEPGEESEEHIQQEITVLKEKIEGLEEEKSSLLYQVQRLQADFINFRKRVNKEKETLNTEIKSELIGALLPVIDNFERALASHEGDDDFYKGVEMIYRQLTLFLEKQEVEVIPAVGEPFDHNFHEAVMQVEDNEHESGVIIEELQKGYKLHEKVIRPSMVKVAK